MRSTSETNMGSLEVYDYKLQKWVPYVSPSVEEWERRFDRLNGIDRNSTALSKRLTDTEEKLEDAERQLEETKKQLKRKLPTFTHITPVAQAIQMAKSEIERKRIVDGRKDRRKSTDLSDIKY